MADTDVLDFIPAEAREELMKLPPDVRDELLAAAMHELQAEGTRDRVNSISAMQAEEDQRVGIGEGQHLEQARWHGLLGGGTAWNPPKLAAGSEEAARPGYNAYSASEYMDNPEVLSAKTKLLAQMWRRSGRDTVVYTGAGLSTASGIGDYASKAMGSVAPHKKQASTGSRLELKPTIAHHALAALEERGLIGNWVQQNHDRLAQKAGFPQAKLNEIHGAWGDNKNQVKMMDDTLRRDLLEWLVAWAERANLCIALGTSLCGMNADQVPQASAERFNHSRGEGLVIIGLQRTVYDKIASLRIWGFCDDVMKSVAKELGCRCPDPKVAKRGADWERTHPRLTYNTPTRSARDPL
mmetsp:Transcript_15453/g.42511  ORF Transcript_15453/g.42511 Transcript_15453/m.42511 type:complete len:353 (-) Transcript_15453:133-1191(-)|eukprot:CAMPEP_0117558144 /NCGR_PEP_ID=MMETSP0784-20121206/52684_1 /TAXON_ID=39447 /ORGANISM="" /LENGTH=352 /DNA_ID=CAMNT_0005355463 /DNA_START=95 /DNA_END=1153 /DNA_ORIENTATION=-